MVDCFLDDSNHARASVINVRLDTSSLFALCCICQSIRIDARPASLLLHVHVKRSAADGIDGIGLIRFVRKNKKEPAFEI